MQPWRGYVLAGVAKGGLIAAMHAGFDAGEAGTSRRCSPTPTASWNSTCRVGGQTFGVWGVGTGPAVQLPLFGPSNVRDSVGSVLGFVANPVSYIPGGAASGVTAIGAGGGAMDGRSRTLDATNSLEKTSLDYYATLRSISAQRRAALVQEGKNGGVPGRVAINHPLSSQHD